MKPFTSEQILAVLTGVLLAGCDKPGQTPKAEPVSADRSPAAAASAAPPPAASAVNAKEVPAAAGSAAAKDEKEMGCAPGGCAPGKCGGNSK